jgi:hypothetical protein
MRNSKDFEITAETTFYDVTSLDSSESKRAFSEMPRILACPPRRRSVIPPEKLF